MPDFGLLNCIKHILSLFLDKKLKAETIKPEKTTATEQITFHIANLPEVGVQFDRGWLTTMINTNQFEQ